MQSLDNKLFRFARDCGNLRTKNGIDLAIHFCHMVDGIKIFCFGFGFQETDFYRSKTVEDGRNVAEIE